MATKKQAQEKTKDDRIAELREYFDVFDKDGDGSINSEELGTMLLALGQDISGDKLEEFLKQVDTDGNGTIDFSEFLTAFSFSTPSEDTDADILMAFRVLDKDGDGYISGEELRHVLTVLGEVLTDEEIYEMIREADTNGDGQIDYEEFVAVIKMK